MCICISFVSSRLRKYEFSEETQNKRGKNSYLKKKPEADLNCA